MTDEQQKLSQLIKKVEALKKTGEIDLSMEEDLSIAIMNLVSLEEHFFFTAKKTAKDHYFDLLNEIRQTRKLLMEKLVNKNEGETWCISKHLLAAAMRLIEVGTKLYAEKREEEAKEIFDKSYQMYSLFWALRLKLINPEQFKKIANEEKPWTLQDIVNKLVDCCEE